MPWNSGVFTRIYNWVTDAANNINITASRVDGEDNNFSNGLNNCLTKDGLNRAAADIPPNADNSYNLGTATLRWIKGFFRAGINIMLNGATYAGDLTSETLTAARTWTLPDISDVLVPLPIGAIIPYTVASSPNSKFLLCDGALASRTTYATLFSIIGTSYGAGDGSTTFGLPDLRGRVIAGYDAGNASGRLINMGAGTVGNVGGEQSHTLSQSEMPSHTHTATVTDPGHTHSYTAEIGGGNGQLTTGGTSTFGASTTGSNTAGITVSNANTGGSTAHNNVQPTIVLNYLIRAL